MDKCVAPLVNFRYTQQFGCIIIIIIHHILLHYQDVARDSGWIKDLRALHHVPIRFHRRCHWLQL